MKQFKQHIAEIYTHLKCAEAKWPAGIKHINSSAGMFPSQILAALDKARAESAAESPNNCSFRASLIEEMLEACAAANEGDWEECYKELADAGVVVIRAMELIGKRLNGGTDAEQG